MFCLQNFSNVLHYVLRIDCSRWHGWRRQERTRVLRALPSQRATPQSDLISRPSVRVRARPGLSFSVPHLQSEPQCCLGVTRREGRSQRSCSCGAGLGPTTQTSTWLARCRGSCSPHFVPPQGQNPECLVGENTCSTIIHCQCSLGTNETRQP